MLLDHEVPDFATASINLDTGVMTFSHSAHLRLSGFVRHLASGTTDKATDREVSGLVSVAHETIHFHTQATPEGMIGAGKHLEEVCCEHVARSVPRAMGCRSEAALLPGRIPSPWRSYDQEIIDTRDALVSAFALAPTPIRINDLVAADLIAKAAPLYFSQTAKHPLDGPTAVVSHFVDCLDLSDYRSPEVLREHLRLVLQSRIDVVSLQSSRRGA